MNTYIVAIALIASACNVPSCLSEPTDPALDASIVPEPTPEPEPADAGTDGEVEHIVVDVILIPLDGGSEDDGIILPPEEAR